MITSVFSLTFFRFFLFSNVSALLNLSYLSLICFLFIFLFSRKFSFNSAIFFLNEFSDEVSLYILLILLLVIFLRVNYYYDFFSSSALLLSLTRLLIIVACYYVFVSTSALTIYLFYELSLIPILYIIIKWGVYPDRSLRALILLIYTIIFSFPLMRVLLVLYLSFYRFNVGLVSLASSLSFPPLLSLLVFLSFAVKLPIYGLHFWLPIAHVEAPTFGSIILAGVLLKLGGVGLIRFQNFILFSNLKDIWTSYFLIFLLIATITCFYQIDFKRLVAYSSVSHIITIPLLFLSPSLLSIKRILLVIFYHGLCSPILFIFVGILYNFYSTRQLYLIQGLLLISPLLSLLVVFTFFYNLSAPPFPSFLREAFFILSVFSLSSYSVLFLGCYVFLGLVYNLNWLRSILFRKRHCNINYVNSHLDFKSFFPVYVALIFTFIRILFLLT